jgi:hypothetical protein
MPRRLLVSVLVLTAVVGAALATALSVSADDDICPPTGNVEAIIAAPA